MPTIALAVSSVFFLLVLVLVLFGSGCVDFACKNYFISSRQFLYFLISIFCVLSVHIVHRHSHLLKLIEQKYECSPKLFSLTLVIVSIILFAIQIHIVSTSWFTTGWDVGCLTYAGAFDDVKSYFSTYQNQVFLYCVFGLITKIGLFFGIETGYLSLVVGSCLSVTVSIALVTCVAKNKSGSYAAFLFYCLSVPLVGLSPWILVPYSDSYGMLCPSAILFCWTCIRKDYVKWPLIGLFGIVGYSIKPTSVFILCCIILVELFGRHYKKLNQGLISILVKRGLFLLTGIMVASCLINIVEKDIPSLDDESAFTMTHFLMMGANTVTNGVYYDQDVILSGSANSVDERQKLNMQEWENRINSLGLSGVVDLLGKKTLTNFADGTFAWGVEGHFWGTAKNTDSLFSKYCAIGDFDGSKRVNPPGQIFQSVAQVLWLVCLVGLCLLYFINKEEQKIALAMVLTLVMLSVFLAIFECRARYLFLYSPYFALLGIMGWNSFLGVISKRLGHIEKVDEV